MTEIFKRMSSITDSSEFSITDDMLNEALQYCKPVREEYDVLRGLVIMDRRKGSVAILGGGPLRIALARRGLSGKGLTIEAAQLVTAGLSPTLSIDSTHNMYYRTQLSSDSRIAEEVDGDESDYVVMSTPLNAHVVGYLGREAQLLSISGWAVGGATVAEQIDAYLDSYPSEGRGTQVLNRVEKTATLLKDELGSEKCDCAVTYVFLNGRWFDLNQHGAMTPRINSHVDDIGAPCPIGVLPMFYMGAQSWNYVRVMLADMSADKIMTSRDSAWSHKKLAYILGRGKPEIFGAWQREAGGANEATSGLTYSINTASFSVTGASSQATPLSLALIPHYVGIGDIKRDIDFDDYYYLASLESNSPDKLPFSSERAIPFLHSLLSLNVSGSAETLIKKGVGSARLFGETGVSQNLNAMNKSQLTSFISGFNRIKSTFPKPYDVRVDEWAAEFARTPSLQLGNSATNLDLVDAYWSERSVVTSHECMTIGTLTPLNLLNVLWSAGNGFCRLSLGDIESTSATYATTSNKLYDVAKRLAASREFVELPGQS